MALAGLLVAVVAVAQRPRGGLASVSGQNITPASVITNDLTVNGDAGVAGFTTFQKTVYTDNIVLDGGSRICTTGTAACTTSYIAGDGFGKINFTGPVSFNNNIEAVGTIQSSDNFIALTGIKNTGTGATCSGNTGAVCINDTGGLAVADGAGATVASISAAGAIAGTALTLNSLPILTPIDVPYSTYLGRSTGSTGTIQEMGATANASTITAINWTPQVIGVGAGNIVIKYCGDATCAGTTYGTITASCTGAVATPVAGTIDVAAMAKAVDPFWYVSTACATTNPLGNLVAHHTQP